MAESVGTSVVPDLPIMRSREREQRATFFELFFDLVYVFAVTQLSHHLLAGRLSVTSVAETALMLVAAYWAWNYTTWMTNWFDPDTTPVRLILVVVMLASLLMAVGISDGFGDRALLFAASYAGLQVARNVFVVAVTPRGPFHQNFVQILTWTLLSLPFWLVGGVFPDVRWPAWLAALAIDLLAPLVQFWLPGPGRTPHSYWRIDGAHFSERFELFVIIALGESVVMTGATASSAHLTGGVVTALILGFLSATAMWWLYFDCTARHVSRRVNDETDAEIGAIGRDVYTYLHLPIVAGVVLTAVADEIVIAHPHEHLTTAQAAVTLAGPAIFLLGLIGCLVRVGRRPAWTQIAGAALLVIGIPLATRPTALVVDVASTALLVLLVVAELVRTPSEPH